MDYKNEFHEIYKHLEKYNFHPTDDLNEAFLSLVKASFTKCLEFNLFLQNDFNPRNSFFYTPVLRGICEDLITLKYLQKHFITDRDEFLRLYVRHLISSSVEAQTVFFNKFVPDQISIKSKNDKKKGKKIVDSSTTELKRIMEKNGLNKDRIFPSIEYMAIDWRLKHLYDFFYHATSRMVHFSPNILLRMGWFDIDDNNIAGPTVFSSHNFYEYYEQFNKFYACYLFVKFSNEFESELNFDIDFKRLVKKLKSIQDSNSFYPELVTFEDFNYERPIDDERINYGKK